MQDANTYSQLFRKTQKKSRLHNVWREHQHLFHWRPQESVLDVGCGPGDITTSVISSWLPEDYRLMVGVDVSHSVINHALTYNESEKLTFEVLDIGGDVSDFLRRKEFSPRFNKIFSFYTLHWLHDLEKGVENLFKLLANGGEMLLFFPVDRLFQKTFKEVRSKDPWNDYSKGILRKIPPFPKTSDPAEEFRKMLLSTGFEVVKSEVRDMSSTFDCVSDMKDLIQSLDPDINSIPLDLRTKYLQHCLEVLLSMQVLRCDDSCIFFTQSILVVVARKPQDCV